MSSQCPKCNGTGFIEKFSGIANGECFRCLGEGITLTASERTEILVKRSGAADRRLARENNVSVETVIAYCAPRGSKNYVGVPSDERGHAISIQEFEIYLKTIREEI